MATSWAYQDFNRREVVTDDENDADTSWANHVERTGRGGVDHVAPLGTPVYADVAGVVDLTYLSAKGSGGRQIRITDPLNWKDYYLHLSDFVVKDGATVKQGDLIGHSGGSGNGVEDAYIPHLHRHRIDPNGVRQNPWHYWAGDGISDTRDVEPGPIVETLATGVPNVTFWRNWQWFGHTKGTYRYAINGAWMPIAAWKGVQAALRDWGYGGAIDGKPGIETYKAGQRFARSGGYGGAIDGDWGPNTYKGLSVALNNL